MKPLSWQHVTVIFLVLASIVTLGALGRDTAALIGLGIALLVGLGIVAGQQGQIKDAANGNLSLLISLVKAMSNQLAMMSPPSTSNERTTLDE